MAQQYEVEQRFPAGRAILKMQGDLFGLDLGKLAVFESAEQGTYFGAMSQGLLRLQVFEKAAQMAARIVQPAHHSAFWTIEDFADLLVAEALHLA